MHSDRSPTRSLARLAAAAGIPLSLALAPATSGSAEPVSYHSATVRGIDVFYREAGPRSAPTVLLLHGFPTSSHMFRDLIPELATDYHVIAPDYPGFGYSSQPTLSEFDYSFEALARVVDELTAQIGVERYALYMQDYGGPVGFRLALSHPERVTGLIIQNATIFAEGWNAEATRSFGPFWQNRTAETEAPMRALLKRSASPAWARSALSSRLREGRMAATCSPSSVTPVACAAWVAAGSSGFSTVTSAPSQAPSRLSASVVEMAKR